MLKSQKGRNHYTVLPYLHLRHFKVSKTNPQRCFSHRKLFLLISWGIYKKLLIVENYSNSVTLQLEFYLTLKRQEKGGGEGGEGGSNRAGRDPVIMTCNVSINHIFPKIFIEIPQVIQKMWRFSPSILTIFIDFLDFLTFLCCKDTNVASI